MAKVAVFFGPLKGAVNRVADKIQTALGDEVVLIPIKESDKSKLESFDKIIFGISTIGKDTWDSEFSSNDWAKFLPVVDQVDFTGKTVAIYGLGDHITYSGNFVDHIGILAKILLKNNARIIGQVSPDDYDFYASEAIFDGQFIGLPLDEDFEPELTDQRLGKWLEIIKPEFGLKS